MNRAIRLCTVVLVTTLAAAAAPRALASSAGSDAFTAGAHEFESGEWAAALAHFQRARDAGMQGPAVWHNIGVSQYRLGRYEDAEATFRALAERFSSMAPLADYNLGLALARREHYAQARSAFARAASTSDATVAALADAMLNRLAVSSLDGEGFERRIGGALAAARVFGEDTELSARATHEEVGELEPRFGFVAGSREMLELRLEHQAGPGRFSLEYELTLDDRAQASVSPTRHELSAGYRRWLVDDWSAGATVSLRSSRYEELLAPRDEDRAELTLFLAHPLPAGWQLIGQLRLSDNDSNVEGFSYRRNRVAVGLNRVFQ